MYNNVIFTDVMPNVGGADPDFSTIEFYFMGAPAPGTWDLSMGADANYATCVHCVLLYQDVPMMGAANKLFFQESGTMAVTAFGANPNMCAGSLTNVKVIEVTIDPVTFTSTPVPGGACYTIASAMWDTQ